ncbi:quinol monooxygenase YgiN [Filimonas zeae]|uniref:ABM domain-containing protein n=1 Tax=Filimonas zeae TaxID=1737353 RepID=A0A917MSV6_9BACT|nr:putative quinol monooxygenase [Filimonas zeae]MDR6338076.1 quinol monooxygenase YgiN [Filimonas zeae]GGH61593.1 hypothetical protein GCM10011379_10730 [Filimonas zeae]
MSTQPIHVFAKWQVKAGQLDKVLLLLREVVRQSREEAGNLFYTVNQSTTDANTIVLYEGYAGEEALDAHRNAAYFQETVVAKIVPLLENREVIITTSYTV